MCLFLLANVLSTPAIILSLLPISVLIAWQGEKVKATGRVDSQARRHSSGQELNPALQVLQTPNLLEYC